LISLAELGAGYLAAGHEPVLIIPGERDGDRQTAQGRVITLRAPRVPFSGGYRVLWRRRRLAGLLARLRPDALEVSDRTTLRWTGAWAREHGVPAAMVSHESVTALLKLAPLRLAPGLSRAVADWLNRSTARAYQQVICTTNWAAAKFERIGMGNLVRVPLGVDLDTFTPRASRPGPRAVQPAADQARGGRLDGHQGHRVAGPAVKGPGAGPGGAGGARVAGR
jgi:alpha-1,6-mannosyltransferase